MVDEGAPVHYSAVSRGTPVYGSDEVEVGKVDAVLDNYDEHIFDGIVLENPAGELRFVDAPEVQRTAERAVTLVIDSSEAANLPTPEKAPPSYRPSRAKGRIGRIFGGGWKKR
jgi:hypothetical protein